VFVSAIESQQEVQGEEWADRSRYWLESVRKHTPKRKRRERQATPLILTGHGISLKVDKSTLLISDGHTHYPAKKIVRRFFRGDLTLPTRIVLVDGSGHVTLDALDWLAEQGTTLIRLKWDGQLISVVGAESYLYDTVKVDWQVVSRRDETARLAFAVPLIVAKAKASLFNLENVLPPFHSKMRAIRVVEAAIDGLRKVPPTSINELLTIEGRIAAIYFNSWRSLGLTWIGLTRHPIPDHWHGFRSRSALRDVYTPSNRNATHPINAMLNYAYGMLEGHVRIGVLADGYDPIEGIMHSRATRDRHSFVFDLMEPLRPVVDRAVLKLINEETFSGADFILQQDGVCRLGPELARRVVHEVGAILRLHAPN